MRTFFQKILLLYLVYITSVSSTFAQETSFLGIANSDLRNGNVNMDSIPIVIATLANVLIGLAGTISIFMLIYFAVKMQLNSGITGDSSGVDGAKKWMFASLVGFIISLSAWFIVGRIVDFLNIVN